MRSALVSSFCLLSLVLALPARTAHAAPPPDAEQTVAQLLERARTRVSSAARVGLAPVAAEALTARQRLFGPAAPNYLRVFGHAPHAIAPLADLLPTFLFEGTIAPETKIAMALRMAQLNGSPYVGAHMVRLLGASASGRALANALRRAAVDGLPERDQLAIAYAAELTRGVHGVSPEQFARTRAVFNDAEIVELTMTVSLVNYLTRLVEALRVPVDAWALDSAAPEWPAHPPSPRARVALISDEEIAATSAAAAAAGDPEAQKRGLGLGMANSQRAMLRVPALARAWRAYGTTVRERAALPRELLLHVSLAVSTVNGCRYCTLHQVLGLRRQGVEPSKLLAMQKDDAALTPRERAAVTFARALTARPGGTTDEDWAALRREFDDRGALEVLLQTCAFAFMNRFTDGLELPSEDEAIRVYKETYGTN